MMVLICNAGSTSLKFKLYHMPAEKVVATGRVERVGSPKDATFFYANLLTGVSEYMERLCVERYQTGIELFLNRLLAADTGVIQDLNAIERVGFKTVLSKGYYGVHELTDSVLLGMEAYLTIAPAHNAAYLAAIRQFKQLLPHTPMIGVFETAFHTSIPDEKRIYSVPYAWYETYGVQKLGYHGASHCYVAETVCALEGEGRKIISCHLGGSCSLCAIQNGKSVDNSFGFSLQCGVMHANRSGSVDPYIIPFMVGTGMGLQQVMEEMTKNGGLKGISGVSGDYRQVEEAAAAGNKRAALAIEIFINDIIKEIGAYAAELNGVDTLVFTAGIGENAPELRARVCAHLSYLGIVLDPAANYGGETGGNRLISAPASKGKVWVIPANEELIVARKSYAYQLQAGEDSCAASTGRRIQ